MIYFTSDLHFGHSNVVKYSRRPFADLAEMEAALIANWNARVTAQDSVYVLGDFSMASPARTLAVLEQLAGQKFLVRGNHDKGMRGTAERKFGWVKDLYELKVPDADVHGGNQIIALCHYAMLVWNKSHFGAWMLHGHSHGSMPDDPNALRLDVGVDCWNYAPVSYDEIKARMRTKTWKPVDHHGRSID